MPKGLRRVRVVPVALVRVTVHATPVAALLAIVNVVLGLIFSVPPNSLLLRVLILPLAVYVAWVVSVRAGAGELFLEAPLQADMDGMLSPIAFALAGLLLVLLFRSPSVNLGWLVGGSRFLLLSLALGYFVAPLLIRKGLLARLVESHRSK